MHAPLRHGTGTDRQEGSGARRIGHRSHGGVPRHALVTPADSRGPAPSSQVEGIYTGMRRLAEQFGISLAGGESSGLPSDGMIISVALTGEVRKGRPSSRQHRPCGRPDCRHGRAGRQLPPRHTTFVFAQSQEGGILAASGLVTAMMDLSDGLGADLPRPAAALRAGIEAREELLPVRQGFTAAQAVADGED